MTEFYKYLEWDSAFFGFKVAQINCQSDWNNTLLIEIINNLKKEKYRLVYLFTQKHNNELEDFFKHTNSIFVDEKITYSKTIDKTVINENIINNIIEYPFGYVNEELIYLAIQSSAYSRFRVDTNIGNEQCDRLYQIWIERSVKKEIATKVFIYDINNSIQGLITLERKKENIGKIGLLSVNSSMRGKNIGNNLVQSAITYFLSSLVTEVEVVTQKQNLIACNFYEKCGFSVKDSVNIYHIWL